MDAGADRPARPHALSKGVLARDPRAIARAISVLENGASGGAGLIRDLFRQAGRARVIGVTGSPGVGKSTLVDCLVSSWRGIGRTVAVLAVDPTSPFSGGAILGDRIRMQSHAADQGVFVRSMATRGHLGGLAYATSDAVDVLDAAGMDIVMVETVGVGQGEVDIARTAHVSIVVTVPGTGDDVQALKAGIMEIGDIFVVNKADRDGADRAAAEIEAAMSLRDNGPGAWHPPVLKTEATSGVGVAELVATLEAFGDHQHPAGEARRREWAAVRLREIVMRRVAERIQNRPEMRAAMEEAIEQVARHDLDPYSAVDQMLEQWS